VNYNSVIYLSNLKYALIGNECKTSISTIIDSRFSTVLHIYIWYMGLCVNCQKFALTF